MTELIANDVNEPVESLFAAQPIFDVERNRVAVELLYRNSNGVTALELGDDIATTELVYNLCSGISNQIASYSAPVFINVSTEFLLSGRFLPLDPEHVVIELVERITPSVELTASVAELKRRGFKFALDDLEFDASWEPLLALADYVKVDILTACDERVSVHMRRLKKYPLTWLAERVETIEQYEKYKAMGFSLFQGYFLARPELVTGTKVPVAALKLAMLIEVLFEDEPDINQLSALLNDEPTLVLGMLRIANSPLYRKTRDVSSVKELVMRLGLDLTRKWILMFAVLNQSNPATASLVLTRAYFLLKLAQLWEIEQELHPQFFLTGLLSGVDLIYNVAPENFVADLSVSEVIKQALCQQQGDAAEALALVKDIEQANAMKSAEHDVATIYFSHYNSEQYFVQEKFSQFGA